MAKSRELFVRLTGLFCLDSAALLMLNDQQFYLLGQIQTNQAGGQPYSDTSPMASVLWKEYQCGLGR